MTRKICNLKIALASLCTNSISFACSFWVLKNCLNIFILDSLTSIKYKAIPTCVAMKTWGSYMVFAVFANHNIATPRWIHSEIKNDIFPIQNHYFKLLANIRTNFKHLYSNICQKLKVMVLDRKNIILYFAMNPTWCSYIMVCENSKNHIATPSFHCNTCGYGFIFDRR